MILKMLCCQESVALEKLDNAEVRRGNTETDIMERNSDRK